MARTRRARVPDDRQDRIVAELGALTVANSPRSSSWGTLHFLEYGLAPDERVRRWQRRLDPVQKRIAGGCHFTRPIVELLMTAGFMIKELDVFYEKDAMRFAGAGSLGSAHSP
jgi:hypothetical protein